MKKKKKRQYRASSLLMVLTVLGMITMGLMIFVDLMPYIEGEVAYKKLNDKYVNVQQDKKMINFEALKMINPDIVGWISFDEPKKINYPVVKSKDNEEYLMKTFEGKYNKYGSIFMDKDNDRSFNDKNTIIYGHNLGFGTGMFSELTKYKNSDFRNKYPYFYIHTVSGESKKYKIFFADYIKNTDRNYQNRFADAEDFSNYLAFLNDQITMNQLTLDSKIVSLSTCAKPDVVDDDRFLVQGVLVS